MYCHAGVTNSGGIEKSRLTLPMAIIKVANEIAKTNREIELLEMARAMNLATLGTERAPVQEPEFTLRRGHWFNPQ